MSLIISDLDRLRAIYDRPEVILNLDLKTRNAISSFLLGKPKLELPFTLVIDGLDEFRTKKNQKALIVRESVEKAQKIAHFRELLKVMVKNINDVIDRGNQLHYSSKMTSLINDELEDAICQIHLKFQHFLIRKMLIDYKTYQEGLTKVQSRKLRLEAEQAKIIHHFDEIKKFTLRSEMDLESFNFLISLYDQKLIENQERIEELQELIGEYRETYVQVRGTDDPNSPNMICSICAHHVRTHVLPCGHFFCQECIDRLPTDWQMSNAVYGMMESEKCCPNCKKRFKENTAIKVFF